MFAATLSPLRLIQDPRGQLLYVMGLQTLVCQEMLQQDLLNDVGPPTVVLIEDPSNHGEPVPHATSRKVNTDRVAIPTAHRCLHRQESRTTLNKRATSHTVNTDRVAIPTTHWCLHRQASRTTLNKRATSRTLDPDRVANPTAHWCLHRQASRTTLNQPRGSVRRPCD